MSWALLVGAVLAEVAGTLALRAAAHGRRAWTVVVVVGYLLAFVALSGALARGVPLGVAYGIWTAMGVALTAVASHVLFDEPLTPIAVTGIALIAAGVLLVETGH